MIETYDKLLLAGVVALTAVVLFSMRPWGAARQRNWVVASLLVLLVAAAASVWTPWPGLITGAMWVVVIAVPSIMLRRMLGALLLEDFDRAERCARFAAHLHPTDAMKGQVETIRAARVLDAGDVERGLDALRRAFAAHPEVGSMNEGLEARVRQDWGAAHAWMAEHFTAAQKTGEAVHALAWIRSLGETGALDEMVAAYDAAAKQLSRQHPVAEAIGRGMLLAFCGREEALERLLSNELRSARPQANAFWRATAAMAGGNAAAGRVVIEGMLDDLQGPTRLAAERRLASPPARADQVLTEESARRVLSIASLGVRAARTGTPSAWGSVKFVFLVGLITLFLLKPWRSQAANLGYLTHVLGEAADDAALPMIVALHGQGDLPEWFDLVMGVGTPVRVVEPAGPHAEWLGHSWYDPGEELGAVDELVWFLEAVTSRHSTVGRPIVIGFSQGGVLTYLLAATHPELLGGAIAAAGALPGDLPPPSLPAPPLRVVGLHGADDDVIVPHAGAAAVERLRARGLEAGFFEFDGVGHGMDDAMRGRIRAELSAAVARALAGG